jgi:NAD(P)-dependent dehydrogenase (short-subunit alcohol dehydrogenase family)
MAGRVWLITGTSSGFGRAIADEALSLGDAVDNVRARLDDLRDELSRWESVGRATALD